MSLQVWLPLNGSTVNQGISNVQITNTNATVDNAGKLGKCYSFNGSNAYIKIALPQSMTTLINTTVCMWMKSNNTSLLAGGGISHDRDSSKACCTLFAPGWQFLESSAWSYVNAGFPKDTNWHHYACCIDNSNIYTYFDGVLKTTTAIGNRLTDLNSSTNFIEIGCDHPGGNEYLNGFVNDFRIYDHCLSPREVKEIAKGLVCHYPLNQIDKSVNLVQESATFNSPWACASIWTRSLDDDGFTIMSANSTGITTNNWRRCVSNNIPISYCTDGISVLFEFMVDDVSAYDHTCICSLQNYSSDGARHGWIEPKYSNTSYYQLYEPLANGRWIKAICYFDARNCSLTTDGTTGNTISYVNVNFNIVKNGSVHVKKPKVVKGKVKKWEQWSPAWTDADSWFDTTEYDVSGFGNHGTAATASAPTRASDSPRYDGCYAFNGSSQFLKAPQSAKITDEITASIWAYMGTWGGDIRLISCTESGGWNIKSNSDYIAFLVYAGGSYRTCKSSKKWASLTSGWHHFAVTYNGLKSCLYIDGVLDTSITPFTTKTPITYNSGNTIFIGAEAASNATAPTTPYFNGKLSDFRLYATALSAEDIKELYNSPITVTNTGVLMTQGEFKEE